MAKDFNKVHLCGLVGDDFRFGKTSEGREFATFSLCINAYDKFDSDDTERTHSQTFVRIFVYDKKQLEYLHTVGARRGQRMYINGRLSSFKNEYKGIEYITMSVICRDIGIIKTK